MALYKKLGYIGSIWILVGAVPLFTLGIIVPLIMAPIMRMILAGQPEGHALMSNIFGFSLVFGFVGIAIGITSILAIRKLPTTRKQLPMVLILCSSVFIILQIIGLNLMDSIFYGIAADHPLMSWTERDYEAVDNYASDRTTGTLLGMIPSFILLVSGLLAWRAYHKPVNPIG